MLSSRLRAFVMPTSQKKAITIPSTSFVTSSTRSPAAIAIPAAANWAASFATGLIGRTSSTSPATTRIAPPAMIPASSHDASSAPTRTATTAPAASPAAIPTPPNVGVMRPCRRVPVGCATSRPPTDGERRRAQSTKDATGSATTVTAALTADKGSPRRGRITPRRPTIAGGAGLRRSPPLPRALRQPVPPRPAREVQGLRPRARVDARAAAGADARLPRRLLGALEGGGDRPRRLLALPPLRPPAVGVPRSLAPDGCAQPRRERAADPQGALPAAAGAPVRGRDAARRVRHHDRDRPRARALVPTREPRHGLARAAGRRGDRPLRRGAHARRRGAQRRLPGRRVRRRRGPAAVVLPDARPLPARGSPGGRVAPLADRPDPLGKPDDPRDRGLPDAALRGRAPAGRRHA